MANLRFLGTTQEILPSYLFTLSEIESLIKLPAIGDNPPSGVFSEFEDRDDDKTSCDDYNEEDAQVPNYIQDNVKLGRLGELTAMRYFKHLGTYQQVLDVADKNSKGYDIELIEGNNKYCCEVKTSEANSFFLTRNEARKAAALTDSYMLFFIKLNDATHKVTGYLFLDPVNALGIPVTDLCALRNGSNNVTIQTTAFKITLPEGYLKQRPSVSLTRWVKLKPSDK